MLINIHVNLKRKIHCHWNNNLGYAADVYEMIKTQVKNSEDDQLYYTKAFLDEKLREKLKIQLDYNSDVFMNLNGAKGIDFFHFKIYHWTKHIRSVYIDDTKLEYNDASGEYFVKNTVTETIPSLLHGNGPQKVLINSFGNYLAGAFKHKECQLCNENPLLFEVNELKKIFCVT